jgi:hypothetical protein
MCDENLLDIAPVNKTTSQNKVGQGKEISLCDENILDIAPVNKTTSQNKVG